MSYITLAISDVLTLSKSDVLSFERFTFIIATDNFVHQSTNDEYVCQQNPI